MIKSKVISKCFSYKICFPNTSATINSHKHRVFLTHGIEKLLLLFISINI